MKIVIIGTGGVGGYFGGKLAKAGHEVTFLARGEHLKAIKAQGLNVKSINGDFTVYPANVTDNINSIGTVDLIILAVKAWQVKEIAKKISPLLNKETLILPLQNGVLASDEIKDFVEDHHVLLGLCRIISKIEAPGVINHIGVDPTIIFGEYDNSRSERIIQLQSIFEQSGIKAKVAHDIHSELWKKFISICTGGYLAISHTTYGEVMEIPETRNIIKDLMSEILKLARITDIVIEDEFLDKTMAFMKSFPYDSTASLTRDIWEGRPSEIEYQNGTVVKLAREKGIPVPINEFVYHTILPMERKARKNKRD